MTTGIRVEENAYGARMHEARLKLGKFILAVGFVTKWRG